MFLWVANRRCIFAKGGWTLISSHKDKDRFSCNPKSPRVHKRDAEFTKGSPSPLCRKSLSQLKVSDSTAWSLSPHFQVS